LDITALNIAAFEQLVEFSKDHPAVQGHFDGRPIVPGVTLLANVLRAIYSRYPQFKDRAYEVVSAKFLSPVEPEASLLILCTPKVLPLKPEQTQSQIEFGFDCILKKNLGTSVGVNTTALKGAIRFAA
jgi:3-hydroxymyristoyl/3-hydroxydecanoyl-(acyl carrier protein) dehydratase